MPSTPSTLRTPAYCAHPVSSTSRVSDVNAFCTAMRERAAMRRRPLCSRHLLHPLLAILLLATSRTTSADGRSRARKALIKREGEIKQQKEDFVNDFVRQQRDASVRATPFCTRRSPPRPLPLSPTNLPLRATPLHVPLPSKRLPLPLSKRPPSKRHPPLGAASPEADPQG